MVGHQGGGSSGSLLHASSCPFESHGGAQRTHLPAMSPFLPHGHQRLLWDGRGRRKERSMRRVGHLRWVLLGSLSLLVTSGHDLPPKKRRIAVSRQRLTRRRSPRENQEVGSKRSCPSRTSLFLDLWVVTATKITCQAVRTQRKKKSSRNKISYPPSGSSPQGILHH